MAESATVNIGKLTTFLILAFAVVLVFYDVEFLFDVAMPSEVEMPDPVAESDFAECYREKDEQLHTTAFATIDNPDVQREFISANQARAREECRVLHPSALITVEEPMRFNLIDLAPRFW